MATSFRSIGSASVEINVELRQLTLALNQARREVTAATGRIERSFERIEEQGKRVNRAFSNIGRAASRLRTSIVGVGAVLGGRAFVQAADTYTQLERQLKLVTDSSEQLASVQERLFQIAQNTRQPLQDVTRLFARFALVTKESGLSQEELLNGVEAVSAAVVQTGVTTREASAGLQQLSQGFGKARLDGDELRSVLENIPVLGQAIAEELGTTVARLRDIGAAGGIGQGVQIRAFRRLRSELGDLSDVQITVSEAATIVQNSLLRASGQADKASGATQGLSDALIKLSEAIDDPAFANFALGFLTLLTNVASGTVGIINTLGNELDRLREEGVKDLADELERTGQVSDKLGDTISNTFVTGINRAVRNLQRVGRDTQEFFGGEVEPLDLSASDDNLRVLQQRLDTVSVAAESFSNELRGVQDTAEQATSGLGDGVSIEEIERQQAIEETTKSINKFIEKLVERNQILRLSEGVERDFGQALRNVGVEFDDVAGKVSNIQGSFEGLGRLRALIEEASLGELTQGVTDYIDELQRQNEITSISSDSQRRLAEELDKIGVVFEVIGGRVRSATISQERLIEIQKGLDASAYAKLSEDIDEYVDGVQRATQISGLQSDQQRELAEVLNELGVEWENVGGRIRILSEILDDADLERITNAIDLARLQEAQDNLDRFVETARRNREIAELSSESQRRFAEALRDSGAEFVIVDGAVKVLNEDLKRTGEVLEEIDADIAADKLRELERAGEQFGSSVVDAIADVAIEGRKLEDVLGGLLRQFARLALQQAIGQGISTAFSGLFAGTVQNPNSGALIGGSGTTGSNGLPAQFAAGGIVRGPVSIAGGQGVMGEAGPEGILPLRVSNGRLGVEATGIGGGNNIQIIDQRANGADIEIQEVEEDGRAVTRAIIRDQVGDMFRTGAIDPGLGNFGIKRQGISR